MTSILVIFLDDSISSILVRSAPVELRNALKAKYGEGKATVLNFTSEYDGTSEETLTLTLWNFRENIGAYFHTSSNKGEEDYRYFAIVDANREPRLKGLCERGADNRKERVRLRKKATLDDL